MKWPTRRTKAICTASQEVIDIPAAISAESVLLEDGDDNSASLEAQSPQIVDGRAVW